MLPNLLAERQRLLNRRWFLRDCGVGLGAIALNSLLAGERTNSAESIATRPYAPKKAKRVIYLFMGGAPSHLELFDHKPQLAKFNGTLPPPELVKNYRAAFINPNSKLLGPKFKFNKVGKNGTELRRTAPAPRGSGGRHRHREVDGHGRVQPRTGADLRAHREPAVRPTEHRGVDHLRPRQRVEGFAGFRRLFERQQGAERREFVLGVGLLAEQPRGHALPHRGRSGAVPLEPRRHRRRDAEGLARRHRRAE